MDGGETRKKPLMSRWDSLVAIVGVLVEGGGGESHQGLVNNPGNPWVNISDPHPYLIDPYPSNPWVYPPKNDQKQPKQSRNEGDMLKLLYYSKWIISHSKLDHFAHSRACFKADGYGNPYPYLYLQLPIQITRRGTHTPVIHYQGLVGAVVGCMGVVRPKKTFNKSSGLIGGGSGGGELGGDTRKTTES